MPVRTADCVLQAATAAGLGPVTLGGAVAGYRTAAAAVAAGDLADGDTVPYRLEAVDGSGVPTGEWETGEGVLSAGGTVLTRTSPRVGSAGAGGTSFAAGPKLLFLTEPDAEPLVLTFGWNNVTLRPVGTVPAGYTVTRVRVVLTTPFGDPASGLTVGTAVSPAAYLAADQIDPLTAAEYETTPLSPCVADTDAVLSLSPGPGEASGAGVVVVEYEPTSTG